MAIKDALLRCAQALLIEIDDDALDRALRALLGATRADFVCIDENYMDPVQGLSVQITHFAEDPEVSPVQGSKQWWKGPYSDFPTFLEGLRAGQPVAVRTSELTGREREELERDGAKTELDIPIAIDGEWVGSICFTDYQVERDWDPEEVETLTTAAAMVAAFWKRWRLLETLQQTIDWKNRFIASVSHEIRTPLTAVIGLAQELASRGEQFGGNEATEFMSLIAAQSADIGHIVDDLLVASRPNSAELAVSREVVELQPLIESVMGEFTAGALARLELQSGGKDARAWGDPARIRQVVRNLISNALRYGGTNIRVLTMASADTSSIMVTDDGIGVPLGYRERIFEPYATAHEDCTQPGSVGLGLSVAQTLARRMGGSIEYRRESGSTIFELRLPSARGVQPAA
ncbi:MAG: GAF domain-containing sensor histidine kinase [Actinomycetota bacterium]